ncbi:MAG: 1-aminocyclopropane-1-carboxylate deaminase/D-cysteine desulfhydrase [Bacteroidia bacterium]|nr:1-aminocyclopropane-1-carboxylate deaminase/D-cysteine desulfhydrase [Bacteroidia bacterium]
MISPTVTIKPILLPNALNVQVDMLMLNELHPLISGNKYFKLLYNISQAQAQGATTLVSMGGAYSNHLVALAVAGYTQGFKTKAYIRGEKNEVLNSHLSICAQHNMELEYVSRTVYATLRNNYTPQNPNEYWIPEGGGNALGAVGCEHIPKFTLLNTITAHYNFDINSTTPTNELFTNNYYNYCVCACGTGTTLAGIIRALQHTQVHTLGIQVLKGNNYLTNELIQKYNITPCALWSINEDFHCGGYAKTPTYLTEFVQQQSVVHNVALENIYTGKMLYAVHQLLHQNYFKPNSRILLIQSGGVH